MSALPWLLLAVAALLVAAPARTPGRLATLASGGRLAPASPRRPRRLPTPSARLLVVALLCPLMAGAALAGGPALAVAAAAACGAGGLLARDVVRGRRAARRRRQLRSAVGVLVSELEAGSRPPAALSAAGECAPEFDRTFAAAAARSADADDAALALLAESDTAPLGHAWRLGETIGAALAGVLGRVADDLAADEAQRRTVSVALSGPRSSAAVLAGLPMLGIGLGFAMGAHPLALLVGSGAGRIVCCVGVLLDVGGLLWIRRILSRAESA